MSAVPNLPLMTCDEFFELPEPTGDFTYELHFGELVEVGRPKKSHYKLQRIIREILTRLLDPQKWVCDIEMPYGLTPSYDARAADIGVVTLSAWDEQEDFMIGSPVLVVQVKSRSNRDRKMEQDAIIHLTHGAAAVLMLKPDRREVVMITASSRTVYGSGQHIELPAPLSVSIAFDDIFPA